MNPKHDRKASPLPGGLRFWRALEAPGAAESRLGSEICSQTFSRFFAETFNGCPKSRSSLEALHIRRSRIIAPTLEVEHCFAAQKVP